MIGFALGAIAAFLLRTALSLRISRAIGFDQLICVCVFIRLDRSQISFSRLAPHARGISTTMTTTPTIPMAVNRQRTRSRKMCRRPPPPPRPLPDARRTRARTLTCSWPPLSAPPTRTRRRPFTTSLAPSRTVPAPARAAAVADWALALPVCCIRRMQRFAVRRRTLSRYRVSHHVRRDNASISRRVSCPRTSILLELT